MGKKAKVKEADSEDSEVDEVTVTSKAKAMPVLDLKIIIAQDEADSKGHCWNKLWAGPGSNTTRKFCIICGCPAQYTCVACAGHKPMAIQRYFCGIRCQKIHEETDCGKPMELTKW